MSYRKMLDAFGDPDPPPEPPEDDGIGEEDEYDPDCSLSVVAVW